MNIFVLDYMSEDAAKMLCDKHIVKMPLESAQMLSSVWHRYGHGDKVQYKEAFKNHPCTLWAGDSFGNYNWLWYHGLELCFEYTRRYNKIHKCQQVIMDLSYDKTPFDFESSIRTPHVQCMPDHYKDDDPVRAYRKYYIGDKSEIATWNKVINTKPYWMEKEEQQYV
tara:strand:- start:4844 stop:5344 length:501 start_codon:yes stop_codon:yes gene_type:complete